MIVFGKRNKIPTHPTTTEFLKIQELKVPSQPSDDDLPELPEALTWSVRDFRERVDLYVAHEARLDQEWLTFIEITGYKWVYNGFNNTWQVQNVTQVLARVKSNHIVEYRVVREP